MNWKGDGMTPVSRKRDYNMRMQVADSVRYREAVTRLKRILYDAPGSLKGAPRSRSPFRDRKGALPEATHDKDEEDAFISNKGVDESQKSLTSLFDMIKKQDDLIAQLEKENIFLKNELVCTAEASKEVALQNEAFRKRLTDTLIQMEASPDISSYTNSNEKTDEIISCLKEERERLVECIQLQEETIAALRQRETEAIDKVKQSVSLAEDSQTLTDKVRESSDLNRKDLQTQVEDAFHKVQVLTQQLCRAHEKEREYETLLRDQEKSLSNLEEDRSQKDLSLKKRDLDYKNEIEDLKRNLKEADDANHRLDRLLQEQRNTSEGTFKRLEALLDRRNLEAETFAKRKKCLEEQMSELKQENRRLLEAINDLAKDRSVPPPPPSAPSPPPPPPPEEEKCAPAAPPPPAASSPDEAREEMKTIKATVLQHHESISHLQDEVTAVRQEMTQEIEGLRVNIEEFCSNVNKEESEASVNPHKKPQNLHNDALLKPEPVVNSPRSEGYESMKEPSGQFSLIKNYGKINQTVEDNSDKLISIPFPLKIRSNGKRKKVEIDLEKKEVDETEDDVTLCSDDPFVDTEIKLEKKETGDKDNERNFDSVNNRMEKDIGKENNGNKLNDESSMKSLIKEDEIVTEHDKEREEITIDVSRKHKPEPAENEADDNLQESAEGNPQEHDASVNDVINKDETKKEESKDTNEVERESDKRSADSENELKETVLEEENEDNVIKSLSKEEVPEEEELKQDIKQSIVGKDKEETLEEAEFNESESRSVSENSSEAKVFDVAKDDENKEIMSDENLNKDIQEDADLEEEKKKSIAGNENKNIVEETSVVSKAEASVSIDQSTENDNENSATDDDSKELEKNAESKHDDNVTEGLEAVVEKVGEEMEEIKEVVELQSKRIESITNKVLALPDAPDTPNNADPLPHDDHSKSKDLEKADAEPGGET